MRIERSRIRDALFLPSENIMLPLVLLLLFALSDLCAINTMVSAANLGNPNQPRIQTNNGSFLIVLPSAASASVTFMDENGNISYPGVPLATKDDINRLISMFQSLNQSMHGIVSGLQIEVGDERSRAFSVEGSLASRISQIAATQAASNNTSSSSLSAEVIRAQTTENSLASSISMAMLTLVNSVGEEKSRALLAENSVLTVTTYLQSIESSRAINTDLSLSAFAAGLSSTETSLAAIDNSLSMSIGRENSRAMAAEASLSSSFSSQIVSALAEEG